MPRKATLKENMKTPDIHPNGLEVLPKDERDFSHHQAFGTLGAGEIPLVDFTVYEQPETYKVQAGDTLGRIALKFGTTVEAFMIMNPKIKDANLIYVGDVLQVPVAKMTILNQGSLDFCTGFASSILGSLLWGIKMSPLWQFAKIKQIRGEFTAYGANLRDACNALVKFGSLPDVKTPADFTIDRQRNFLANWQNWPTELDRIASKYKDGSYLTVDGPMDIFDDIRSALFMNRGQNRGVLFGLMWRPEWTGAPNGVIPDANYTQPSGGGHCIAFIGQKIINGVPYLVLQQTWGDQYGDKGLYYFPRSVVNIEFTSGYGAFIMKKEPKSTILGLLNIDL